MQNDESKHHGVSGLISLALKDRISFEVSMQLEFIEILTLKIGIVEGSHIKRINKRRTRSHSFLNNRKDTELASKFILKHLS